MLRWVDGTEPGPDGLLALARRALALRSGQPARRFDGKRLAAVFLNPSLRTRTSIEAACGALGVQPLIVSPGRGAWPLAFGDGVVMDGAEAEHIRDAIAVLAQYADVLAVRAFAGLVDPEEDRRDPVMTAFAEYAPVPVVNMESALWHPLQGLADAATWLSHLGPDLRGVPLTLTWAPHPKALPAAVPNQVLLTAAMLGMDVTVARPDGFELDPQVVTRASDLAGRGGGRVRCTANRDGAFRGAKVVVAKSWSGWSGYADRQAEAARRAELTSWCVDVDALATTEDAGFMHCLPIRRNVVATDAAIDGTNSWIHEQAGHRMWTAMALLECLLEGSWTR